MINNFSAIVYFTYLDKINIDVNEGGKARDKALFNYLNLISKKKKYVTLNKKKIINLFNIFYNLFFNKENIIVIQYPRIGLPIYKKNIICNIIRYFFFIILRYSDKYNKIFVDVSDLPYEQSVDLELPQIHNNNIIQNLEKNLFNLSNAKYIFASYTMRDYIRDKYKIKGYKTYVCINGGNPVKNQNNNKYSFAIEENKINYIYAGTLNKGRQIEKVIGIFRNCKNSNLILIGADGEWIKELKLTQNIKYFGALNEDTAHQVTTMCDIGIIPYDSSRLYYNIAYPTKLSFYITAGITFLSTNVKEVIRIRNKYNIGYVCSIDSWKDIINTITKNELIEEKNKINLIKQNFYWNNIFKRVKFE